MRAPSADTQMHLIGPGINESINTAGKCNLLTLRDWGSNIFDRKNPLIRHE